MDLTEVLEQRVLADHAAHVGQIILTDTLTGYVGDTDDQVEVFFAPPLAVRLLPHSDGSLFHWVDEWLDPYWDVEILDQNHPQLPPQGLRATYMFGPSYNKNTGECEHGNWSLQKL